MIYLTILFSIIAIQILPNKKYYIIIKSQQFIISKKSISEFILVIELMFITIFRKYTVGTDLRMYTRLFEEINEYSWKNILNSKFEPGYMIYNRFIIFFSDNIQVFIAVTGFLTVGIYIYEIFRKSYDAFFVMYLSLTFGFFFFQFTALRQVIAIALFMFAIDRLEKRKWIDYIFIILIASTFHLSVLVCIPFALIVILPWTNRLLKLIWMIEIVAIVMMRGILKLVVFYFPRYSYILRETTNYRLGYIARIIIISGLYLVSVYYCKIGRHGFKLYVKTDNDSKETFILILGSIATVLMTMINYFESVQRMTYYFIPYVFLCVDIAINKNIKMKKVIPIIYIFLGIYYILCFTGYTSINTPFGVRDYLFFWQ